jgi:hypothetical protein
MSLRFSLRQVRSRPRLSHRGRVAGRERFVERLVEVRILSGLLRLGLGFLVHGTFSGSPFRNQPGTVVGGRNYPAPPTVNISASYPGASAEVIAATVATPTEQEVNGVDDMLYITSQSTGDGRVSIDVVFKAGVNVDQAQVLVQNRVSIAEPRLPEDVRRLGVTVRKASPDLMMVVHLTSPDGSRDQQYISNYTTLYLKDALARVDGVGNVNIFGARRLRDTQRRWRAWRRESAPRDRQNCNAGQGANAPQTGDRSLRA